MSKRSDIVREARTWVGVPYLHQGHSRAGGVDCGGLVALVAVACGIVGGDWWERCFDPDHAGYGRLPTGGRLGRLCDGYMTSKPVDDAAPGDVLLMKFRGEPQHLAIAVDHPAGLGVVHALGNVGRVVEHGVDARWRSHIVAAYAMPGVEEG